MNGMQNYISDHRNNINVQNASGTTSEENSFTKKLKGPFSDELLF